MRKGTLWLNWPLRRIVWGETAKGSAKTGACESAGLGPGRRGLLDIEKTKPHFREPDMVTGTDSYEYSA